MSNIFYCHNTIIIYLFYLLIVINNIIGISSSCPITVPNSVTTQKLNNIICIGSNGFANPNFAKFSNGSLIIETSKDEGSEERNFYGITKEGKPYFENDQFLISFNADNGQIRQESENFVITLNDGKQTEYLISIGKNAEIYDLYRKKVISRIDTNTFIGNGDILDCLIQSGINFYDGNNYYLYYGYLTFRCDFRIKKLEFTNPNITQVVTSHNNHEERTRGKIASCYITVNKNIICIILKDSTNSALVYAIVYDIDLNEKLKEKLNNYEVKRSSTYFFSPFPYFIKCIHLKDEIGVFTFYRSNSAITPVINKPIILFKKYTDGELKDVFSLIELDKEFNNENLLNDLIKINENKLCFISTTENKQEMYIVLLNIYDNANIAIRYYSINIFSIYKFKFYASMRANLYNNYIAFAFSFCPSEKCSSTSDEHYPGFMIFSYPNGDDFSLNLIDIMFSKNEIIDNYTINLENQVRIDNNLFGLDFDIINIQQYSNCSSIKFVSSIVDYVNIIEGYNLGKGENIIAKEIPMEKLECSISYIYIITEPDFDAYNSYTSEKKFPSDYDGEKFKQEIDRYESRLLYYNISIKENLSYSCQDDNCLLCKKDEATFCIICKYNFMIRNNKNGKYKTCFDNGVNISNQIYIEETEEPETDVEKITNFKDNSVTEFIHENNDQDELIYQKMLNDEFKNGTLTSKQIIDIYKRLKEKYISKDYDKKPKVISAENVVYQISTFEYQKNNEDPDISSIDLGACESTLKSHYNLTDSDSLVIFKIDTKNNEKKQTYVNYEIYDPNDYSLLDLNLCETKIIINIPVDLDDNSIKLYESLKQYGYNIFDSGDDFYNDICSIYTTINGTDLIIEDRKKDIYYSTGNITMCQSGCDFILYNTTTKKSMCDCEPKIVFNDTDLIEDKFSPKKLASEFLKTIKNSNFRVLKCYKLAINIKELLKNIGRIIMTIIILLYLISLLYYIIKERKKINMFINIIIENNELNFDNKIEKLDKKGLSNKGDNKNKHFSKNRKKMKKKKNKNFPPKKKDKKANISKHSFNTTKRNLKNFNVSNNSHLSKKSEYNKLNINIYPINNMSIIEEFGQSEKKIFNSEILNDQELNSLDYDKAILLDKRTYFQYYWSLLKKKHLILFTIIPTNDYNLYSLKIALFLLSISLYFTINGFFFSDATMHKISEDNGKFDFIYQIPQILYSTVISAIINFLLKILSLSEKNILSIKKEKDITKAKINSKNIRKCIIIKFVIFFLFSDLLLLFFWYFISCFCAVYTNTQIILLKDTLISFGLSMIYPFGINLIPGFFRIPSLRDETQRSKYMYKISRFLALI